MKFESDNRKKGDGKEKVGGGRGQNDSREGGGGGAE